MKLKKKSAVFIAKTWKNIKMVSIIKLCAKKYRRYMYNKRIVSIQCAYRVYKAKKYKK